MLKDSRQLLGILADELEANGKQNVFINRGSSIQYMVRPIMHSVESANYFTGYMSSFEIDCDIEDDEYLADDARIDNFYNNVKDKLFVFSYKKNEEGEFNKLVKASLVPMPSEFDKDTFFYAIPVFSPSSDTIVNAWADEHRWRFYREYNSLEEFTEFIKNKKSVGSLYGYRVDEFSPAFVLWRSPEGGLYAIGNIVSSHHNTLGGLILEGNDIFKIDISDYLSFIVYNVDVNPSLSFVPEEIYKKIEDEILKAAVSIEKKENESVEFEEIGVNSQIIQADKNTVEHQSIVEINKPSDKELIEIDSSVKNDELVIKSMDYHSQKRNLFYSIKDFINVHTAIKCSSLTIMSGLSGTGKSALIDIYARALGINYNDANTEENRLLFIPVRPSWNDDADLLGYVDLVHMVYRPSDTGFVDFLVKAQKNENKMFLVCFDEMNLARVEHYFSQFLSILERPLNQRELQLYDNQYIGRLYNSADYPSRIKIGDNIRFIGTVNIDESTYHFSDKVLDRANVIQLDVLNYSNCWLKKQYATLANVNWTYEEYNNLVQKNTDISMKEVHELLWNMHELLQTANSKYGIGPRIVKAIETYLINIPAQSFEEFSFDEALDYQIMQRVLTKVRGPENQLGDILKEANENSLPKILEKYEHLSKFKKCKAVLKQKEKELETYGYCI